MATLTAVDKSTAKTGWDERHNLAISLNPPIVAMLKAWEAYAEAYKSQWGDPIGTDGYAAPYFEEIAHGINGLLSMDLGRLDGGTLNRFILETLKENGCDPNEA